MSCGIVSMLVLVGLETGVSSWVAPAGGAAPVAKAPSTGTPCRGAGDRTGTGTKALHCVKTSKGLRWTKAGTASPVAPSAAAGVTLAPSSGSSPSTSSAPSSETTLPAAATTLASPSGATRSGTLQGAGPYRAAGRVELSGAPKPVLRFRSVDVQNGPALVVYLTQSSGATTTSGALRIGALATTTGDHDYDVPGGTDTQAYGGVLIWCERFGVPFGTAELR